MNPSTSSLLWALIVLLFRTGSDGVRLPGDTVPESYVLRVEPDLGAKNRAPFSGLVDIAICAKKTTSVITLNSKNLVWEDVKVTDVNTYRDVHVNSWDFDTDRDQGRIWIRRHLLADRHYTISIRFKGILREDATGFFKSYYTVNSDQKKWLAATQFQATHARSAFPCYDEPSYKTPFNISIKRKRNEIALSNMPIFDSVDVLKAGGEEATWVHFAQTPPMSTYLVALFVGDFERLRTDRQNVTNVYSHLGTLYQTDYATIGAPGLLAAAERYTGVPYALPKLDLMAVPEVATVSAADGWGLNVFREQLLFVDKNSKTKTKVSVIKTAGRTFAHQWFGDLVTPVWWDYAWLDFGFATYFEYFVTATLEPKWRLEHFFVVEKHQAALEYDRPLRHSLSVSVNTPEEIQSVFDEISSEKGAMVLKMLHSWVGEDVFRKAVNIYLTRNRYGVVKPQQLWNAFDNALFDFTKTNLYGENFNTIMSTWVEQSGYPVVHVKRLDNNNLILTQERFSYQPSSNVSARDTARWYILLNYTTNEDSVNSTGSVWLDPSADLTICCTMAKDVKWYIFNVQSTGFYRVNYTEENWQSLIEQLNDSPGAIHVLNRAQLIDDSFSLARAGQLNYTIPLSLLRYLVKEDDVIPWFSAMNSLNFVLNRMRRSGNGYDDVKAFVSQLAGVAFQMVDKLVAEQQNPEYPITISWNAFSTWACELDNEDCKKTALYYFRRWRNGEEIPADIKDAAFCTGIKYGTEEGNWAKILELYTTTKSYSEKESALYALACTDDENLLRKYLKLIVKNDCPIQRRDYEVFFRALSSTPRGINALLFFLKTHLTDIVKKVPEGGNVVNTIFSILAPKVSTEREIQMMSEIAFSTETPVDLGDKLSTTYHAEIEYNENWFSIDNLRTIREFVSPGSTDISETTTEYTTQDPIPETSSAPSSLYDRTAMIVLLVVLATLPSGIDWILVE